MPEHAGRYAAYFRKLRRWLADQIVQDVPEEISACEFNCLKQDCRMGEWEKCERRLRGSNPLNWDRVH